MRRDSVLLLVSKIGLLSLSMHSLDLPQLPTDSAILPWGTRCALHIIRLVLARDEEIAGQMERMVRQLEDLPAIVKQRKFFQTILPLEARAVDGKEQFMVAKRSTGNARRRTPFIALA